MLHSDKFEHVKGGLGGPCTVKPMSGGVDWDQGVPVWSGPMSGEWGGSRTGGSLYSEVSCPGKGSLYS